MSPEDNARWVEDSGVGAVRTAIRDARDVDAMAAASAAIGSLVDHLIDQEAAAASITRTVTSLNDLITQRLIDIVGLGAALSAVGGCWIALGSQGRCEQTLATDQDNAIIFAEGDDTVVAGLVPLAQRVNHALNRCGYALCSGEVMAGNPQWCLSAAQWRDRFARWIDEPDPQALLNGTIFFDLRPVHGDAAAAAGLRAWLARYAEDRGRFLLPMARNALTNRPPLGVMRDFILSRGEAHGGTLDLKINGVQLFVETARIYSLANGVTASNTVERLAAVASAGKLPDGDTAAAAEAFGCLQLLRLRLNARQRTFGEPLHNHVDPESLNSFERGMLKEALRQARALQSHLARDFSVTEASFGA
jgi:CBS domain-containing protein